MARENGALAAHGRDDFLGRFTRRGFFLGTAALACTSGACIAAPAGGVPPAGNAGRATVATESDTQEHLTIAVLINGEGPFRFVVDTGADRTVIAQDIAERLKLGHGDHVLVEGIVRTIPAGTVLLESLSLGSVRKEALVVPVIPRELIFADGYLGLDVIDGYRVTFDFLRRVLDVDQPGVPSNATEVYPRTANIPVSGAYGRLKALHCDVDGVAATAFIDSGAQVTIGNDVLGEALQARSNNHLRLARIPITGITGGEVDGDVTSIEEIRLRTVNFKTRGIVIADLQIFETWGLKNTPALLIGMNYLRTFARVSVDYGLKQFRFELAGSSGSRSA